MKVHTRLPYYEKAKFPYVVELTENSSVVNDWCREQFKNDVKIGWWTISFKNEADRTLFLLRWT